MNTIEIDETMVSRLDESGYGLYAYSNRRAIASDYGLSWDGLCGRGADDCESDGAPYIQRYRYSSVLVVADDERGRAWADSLGMYAIGDEMDAGALLAAGAAECAYALAGRVLWGWSAEYPDVDSDDETLLGRVRDNLLAACGASSQCVWSVDEQSGYVRYGVDEYTFGVYCAWAVRRALRGRDITDGLVWCAYRRGLLRGYGGRYRAPIDRAEWVDTAYASGGLLSSIASACMGVSVDWGDIADDYYCSMDNLRARVAL
jgi:hypothetical protein